MSCAPPLAAGLRRAAPLLLLAALCGLLFFVDLGAGELYRNEGLRALVARELLRGGSWAVPTLHGEPLLTKPPGMSVAIALASLPAGAVSPASARLPSALAATLAVLLFFATFARHLGRRAGLAAAALLPCSFLWLQRAPSAEIDMLQLAWVSAALLLFLRALEAAEEARGRGGQWACWQAALLCVAGGLLTKWTAPAFFYLTAVPLLAWRRRLGLLLGWPHLLALALSVALCAAWAAEAAREAGWDVLAGTVRREALQRLSPAHHPRPYPWLELLTFPAGFLLACLPWSACLLPALRPGFAGLWDDRTRRLLQFLHCWAWPNLLFWAVVPGHRPRHALPLQPALAGLAALVWVAWLRGRLRWPLPFYPRPRRALLALLAAWLVVKLVFVAWVVPDRARQHPPRARGEALAALVPDGHLLYLFRLKDEGVLFYYGRPTRRLPGPEHLPAGGETLYCLLVKDEWDRRPALRGAEVVGRLTDEQGAPLVLVRARGRPERCP
jgi:4-amino-4-deoxy-L-arabinose transferase-like glycosyltransferase